MNSFAKEKKPIAVIINGKGGCGKDSLITEAQNGNPDYKIENVSAIDPIKRIMREFTPWDGKTKTAKDRAFMHDLKMLCVRYCDLPAQYLINCYYKAKERGTDLIFMHIREPEEIQKMVKCMRMPANPVFTILIKRSATDNQVFGNHADDDVEDYDYDKMFVNDESLEAAGKEFAAIIRGIIEDTQAEWKENV